MADTMTDAWFHRLKAAMRMLIKLNGGIEASADIVSLSSSEMGRYNNQKDTDLMPVKVIIRLEAECCNPVVTRAMAELQDCTVVSPQDKPADGRCVMRDNGELQRLNGELQIGLAVATADMVITPTEAMASLRNVEALERKIPDLKTSLTQIIAMGGISAGLRVVGG